MTLLLDTVIARTLAHIVERFTAQPATRVEAWLFEDEAARRAAERALAAAGVKAVLRSAYKPLVHFFLEEAGALPPGEVLVATPAGHAQRFRLEAYPLAGLLGDANPLRFVGGDDARHHVVTVGASRFEVFTPNDATLSPRGWLRVWRGDTLVEDAPLKTEAEAAYEAVLGAVRAHPWPDTTPLFDTL